MTKMPFIYFEDLFILFSSIKLGNLHAWVGGAYMLVKVKILTLVLSMRHMSLTVSIRHELVLHVSGQYDISISIWVPHTCKTHILHETWHIHQKINNI